MNRLRIKLSVLVFIVLLGSCSKPTDQQPDQNPPPLPPPDHTPAPPKAVVSGRLMVYTIANDQASNPYYVQLNGTQINYNNTYKAFRTPGTVVMDKYATVIMVQSSATADYRGFTPYKTFTASGAMRNYVNAKLSSLTNDAGYVVFDYGSGTISLPGNGQLVLPPYSFGTVSGPVSFHVYADFLSPSITDYAVTLPCYPMADVAGKRWFLNSYGVYLLSPMVTNYDHYGIDFNPNVNVVLRLPVPANEPSPPDSIGVWNLNSNNLWESNGFAKRNGNYYEKKITKKGYWNFAIPVNGVYTTFRLITSNGFGVPNIRYVIKKGILK
jgi:hypothetical protein